MFFPVPSSRLALACSCGPTELQQPANLIVKEHPSVRVVLKFLFASPSLTSLKAQRLTGLQVESESDCVHGKCSYTSKGRVAGGQQLEPWTQSLFIVLNVCSNVPLLGHLHVPQLRHKHMLGFSRLRDAGPVGALWVLILDYLGRIPHGFHRRSSIKNCLVSNQSGQGACRGGTDHFSREFSFQKNQAARQHQRSL